MLKFKSWRPLAVTGHKWCTVWREMWFNEVLCAWFFVFVNCGNHKIQFFEVTVFFGNAFTQSGNCKIFLYTPVSAMASNFDGKSINKPRQHLDHGCGNLLAIWMALRLAFTKSFLQLLISSETNFKHVHKNKRPKQLVWIRVLMIPSAIIFWDSLPEFNILKHSTISIALALS